MVASFNHASWADKISVIKTILHSFAHLPKVEADRLKQRFVQQNTAVSRGSVRGSGGVASVPKPNNGGSPLNIVAIILILLALLLGYLVGTYIH